MRKSTLFGRPRWHTVLAVVFISQVLNSIGFSLVFPFLPLYVEDLGSTFGLSVEMMAGLVIAAQGVTMMIASPLWGVVADRYGRKMMILRATIGGSVIMALMGVVISGEQLIIMRAIQGLITGTVAANNALVASAVPRERVGFAMGTLQLGLWGGVALGPLLGGVLADSFGFGMPFFITGGLLLFSSVLIYFGVEEDFVPQESTAEKPRLTMVQQWKHVINADGVAWVLLLRFLAGMGRMLIIPIAPLFVVSLLPPDATARSLSAGLIISISSATSTVSGIYLGNLGDRIGHRAILIGASAALVVFYIPQIFVTNVTQLLILQALAGLGLGGLVAAPSALLARYTEHGEEGAVYGLDNSIVAGARAVAPLIGSVVAVIFGLRGTFAAAALIFLVVTITAYYLLPNDEVVMERKLRSQMAAGD